MDVTVLISTWNNAKRLAITLETIKGCVIPQGLAWQLVIVNNNCTGNTDSVVNQYVDILPVVYVKEPIQGLSRARNAGLNIATGKLIIFTDDDVRPCRDWIKVYWEAFVQEPTKQFWGGPIESEFEGEKPDDDLLSFAPSSVRGLDFGPGKRLLSDKECFIAPNWAVPSAIIKKIGPFDIHKGLNPSSPILSTGEETDLMYRLKEQGLSGLYLPAARIQHFVPGGKCTLKHILARCEAGVLEDYRRYDFRLKSWVLFNKPVGLYIHIIVNYIKYLLKRILSKKWCSAYIKLRVLVLVTKSYEERLSGKLL
jgi:glucosyl-dolichyl phosphate glucuronosyltransferase